LLGKADKTVIDNLGADTVTYWRAREKAIKSA
jgi:hypothetical protein